MRTTARLKTTAVLATALLGAALVLAAQEAAIPPAPGRWVTDTAGFLSAGATAALDSRLQDFENRTGHQVLVYIGRTTTGVPIEDWANRAFTAWKVGRKGLDDGLVLFIMAEDRKIRIEVGYGLEDKVPDIRAYRIIDGILVPGIRNGQNDAAVSDAVSSLLSLIEGGVGTEPPPQGGVGTEPPPSQAERRPAAGAPPILVRIWKIAAVILFLIFVITHPKLALFLLINMLSGGGGGRGGGGWGGGGGSGGGGGGFSGGGGGSGGGGASGSW